MIDHVSLGVADLERSRRFYDAALRPLGLVRTIDFEDRGSDYGAIAGQCGVEFTITRERAVATSRGLHLCFRAPDREAVRAFHAAPAANQCRGRSPRTRRADLGVLLRAEEG